MNDFKAVSEGYRTKGPESPKGIGQESPNGADNASEGYGTKPSASLRETLKRSLKSDREPSSSSFSTAEVEAELRKHGEPDDDVVTSFVAQCRDANHTVTAEEVVHFIQQKATHLTPKIRNPIGFLTTSVVKCIGSNSLPVLRKKIAAERDATERAAAEQRKRDHAEHERMLEAAIAALHDPSTPEDEKAMLRKAWGDELTARKPAMAAQENSHRRTSKAGQG